MNALPPFDPHLYCADAQGDPVRYLTHPLDANYLTAPPDQVELIVAGMLPPQEIEVRQAVDEYTEAQARVKSFGWLGRMLHANAYEEARYREKLTGEKIYWMLSRSREHWAAFCRMSNEAARSYVERRKSEAA